MPHQDVIAQKSVWRRTFTFRSMDVMSLPRNGISNSVLTVATTTRRKHSSRVPPVWKPYLLQFQWPPPDIAPGSPQMDKFEKVFSDHCQMSLAGVGDSAGEGVSGLMSWGQRPFTVKSNASRVMVTRDALADRMTDRHD